jgi:hypothetical protein
MPAGSLLPVNEETLQMKRQLDFFNTVAGKKQLAEQSLSFFAFEISEIIFSQIVLLSERQQELEAQARAEEERLAKRQNREEVKNVTLSAAQQSKLGISHAFHRMNRLISIVEILIYFFSSASEA